MCLGPEAGLGPNRAKEGEIQVMVTRETQEETRDGGDLAEPAQRPELVLSTTWASEHLALQQFYLWSFSSSELLEVPVQFHSFSSCPTNSPKCLPPPFADRLKME